MNDELFYFMDAYTDDNAPDGAWQCMLEDAVNFFNKDNGTNYDSFDTFHEYLERKEKEQNESTSSISN